MKIILREDPSGVSEVLGTILILAMTVTLFSVVILWVSNVPTPSSQTRQDMLSTMTPIYDVSGNEIGVDITITHGGGEALQPALTMIYVTDQRGSNPPQTDIVSLHLYNGLLANPNGLVDGTNSVWDIGERWDYKNFLDRSSDTITVTIVDTARSLIIWSGPTTPPAGTRPPIFLSVWTDGLCRTIQPAPVQAGLGFCLYATVMDPDGDLNTASVYATLTAWYGSGTVCATPLQMRDNGVPPDGKAGDGIFSLGLNGCMNPPYPPLSWAGSYILLNATDFKGHKAQTRILLNVVPATSGGNFNNNTIPSQIWQYIGYVQIRTGEVWVSNLSLPYNTATTYQPYRVLKAWLASGALFHFKMANHGNTTIFVDGWTEAFFQNTQSSSGVALYVVAPCSTTIAANAGGVAPYPGIATNINDFEYAHAGLPVGCSLTSPAGVFDINPLNQETGGTPYVVTVYAKTAFATGTPFNWPNSATYFISILVSGMAGPVNYTYAQLTGVGPNPNGCSGLMLNYNPHDHINDPIPACRSSWYAQVIPFIGMVVY